MINLKKNIECIICLIFIVIFLTGCNFNNENAEDLSKKLVAEIEYVDNRIINMLNNLNSLSFQNYRLISQKVAISKESENAEDTGGGLQNNSESKNSQSESETKQSATAIETTEMSAENVLTNNGEDLDWQFVKTEIELLNTSWSIILYDLYKKNNSDNTDILAFSDALDKCIVSIRDENKEEAITNLANLYTYVPKFIGIATDDKQMKYTKETKSNVVNAYSSLEQADWNSVQDSLNLAEESFKKLFEDLEYVEKNEYKINKSFILLKELQNSIKTQEKEVFYLKYINLMEDLNTLK